MYTCSHVQYEGIYFRIHTNEDIYLRKLLLYNVHIDTRISGTTQPSKVRKYVYSCTRVRVRVLSKVLSSTKVLSKVLSYFRTFESTVRKYFVRVSVLTSRTKTDNGQGAAEH